MRDDSDRERASVDTAEVLSSKSFGRLLWLHRTRAVLTQDELASLSAVSTRTIRELERGRALRPRLATVRLLADALDLCGPVRGEFEDAAGGGQVGTRWADIATDLGFDAPPVMLDSLVGRSAQLAALGDLVERASSRLIVVTGVAGIGKSRLVGEWAWRAHDNERSHIWWTTNVATVQEIPVGRPHREKDSTAVESLAVVDGVDDALSAARLVQMLARWPDLRVVATARQPLGVPGEHVVPLGPLDSPQEFAYGLECGGDSAAASPAVQLLARYIRVLDPTFTIEPSNAPVLAEIAEVLGAHPAALIQAATWCGVWSPLEVLERILVDLTALSLRGESDDAVVKLQAATTELSSAEHRLLGTLSRLPSRWSLDDAIIGTGNRPKEIIELIQKLLLRGIVQQHGGAAVNRFSILPPIRAMQVMRLSAA